MAELARRLDGIPVVASTSERNTLYPSPSTNQRVRNLETGSEERWTGAAWVENVITLPANSRTVPNLTAYVNNNAVFNVLDYGAVGNGVTNDQAAIQAAITAASAAGGRVYIPARSAYIIGSGLTINSPNVTVEGDGMESIIQPSGAGYDIITLGSSAHRVQIRNLWIQGAAVDVSTAQHGVFTGAGAAPNDVTIDGCLFGATSSSGGSLNNGVKADGGARWKVVNCSFTFLQGATSNHGYGVLGGATTQMIVSNCNFLGSTGHGRHCVYLSAGCTWCNVGSNIASGYSEEAYTMNAAGAQPANTDNVIHDNQVLNGGQLTSQGAAISAFGKSARNTIRANKIFGYAGSGITLNVGAETSGNCDNNVIADNDIWSTSWDGIALLGASNSVIRDNDVRDSSQASSGTFPGIALRITGSVNTINTLLKGNTCTGATLRAGLTMDAGSTGTVVMDEYYPVGQTARLVTNGAIPKGSNINFGLAVTSPNNGDISTTLTSGANEEVERFNTALTANRTITLSTTNVYDGAKFRVVRVGLGAFTLDVGGLKTIPSATAAFVDVAYSTNAAAWVLTGYGPL